MGDWKRLLIFVLACAGITASLLLPWWVSSSSAFTFEIGLRTVKGCALGECRSVSVGGAYGIVGVAAFVYGWIAVIGLIIGGVLPALSGEPTKGLAYGSALVYLMFAGMAYATLDIPAELMLMLSLHTNWPLWAGLGGASLALAGPMLLAVIDRKEPAPYVPYKPPDIVDHGAAVGGAASLPGARVIPPPRRPMREAIDLDDGITSSGPAVPPVVAPAPRREHRTSAPPMLVAPLLPPPVVRSGLRFAVATAEVRDDGLVAVDEDGSTRQLRWEELGGVLARELRGRPPLDDALLVDLVPRGGRPFRFLTTSRLSFDSVESSDPRDALRQLLAITRSMNDQVELEPATAAFLERWTELPAWTMDELDRYDARYREAR